MKTCFFGQKQIHSCLHSNIPNTATHWYFNDAQNKKVFLCFCVWQFCRNFFARDMQWRGRGVQCGMCILRDTDNHHTCAACIPDMKEC